MQPLSVVQRLQTTKSNSITNKTHIAALRSMPSHAGNLLLQEVDGALDALLPLHRQASVQKVSGALDEW